MWQRSINCQNAGLSRCAHESLKASQIEQGVSGGVPSKNVGIWLGDMVCDMVQWYNTSSKGSVKLI